MYFDFVVVGQSQFRSNDQKTSDKCWLSNTTNRVLFLMFLIVAPASPRHIKACWQSNELFEWHPVYQDVVVRAGYYTRGELKNAGTMTVLRNEYSRYYDVW